MRILFFPQNETHVANMVPVAEVLGRRWGADISFLDLSHVYHQVVFPETFGFNRVKVKADLQRPFYFMRWAKRMRAVRDVRHALGAQIGPVDGVVIGNDGALQRALMSLKRSVPFFLLLDGIISDYSFSLRDFVTRSGSLVEDGREWGRVFGRTMLARMFPWLPWNYYLPSEVGASKVKATYVISPYVRDLLHRWRRGGEAIHAFGLPRYRTSMEAEAEPDRSSAEDPVRLLFISQSYTWHNDHIRNRLQHLELKQLIDLVRAHNESSETPRWALKIRLHPRDIREDYRHVDEECIETAEINIDGSLANSDIVLGFNSTVLLEALRAGKPTCILMTHGQYWRFRRSFVRYDCFKKVFSREDLDDYITSVAAGDWGPIDYSQVAYLFQPWLPDTAERIASDICANLEDMRKRGDH